MHRNVFFGRGLAVCLALCWLSATASAQQPRYERKTPRIKVDVKQTAATKGLKPKAESKKDRMPEISADQFLDIQGQVKSIRAAQIEALKELIKDTDAADPEMPDLLFRLAEQYGQLQRYWRFRAFELYEKIEKTKGSSQKQQLKNDQKKFFKAEEEYLKLAIAAYAKIANDDRFKNYPRMDIVLFSYAFTLQKSKRVELARKVYHKLINNYPESKYIPWAYLSFADFFFQQNDLDNAEKFYDKVLKFPKSDIYSYAMYMKGWVYLNQTKNQEALEVFFKVAQRTKGVKKDAVLHKAAKKDFVRAYAEVGRAEKAYAAFQRVDAGYSFNMLKILAQLYFDQGKAAKAIYTYRELMGLKPKDPAICEWQYNVVQAMISAGNNQEKADEVEKLVKLYAKYRDAKLLKGSQLQECEDNAQTVSSEMAKVWHNESIRTLNPETLVYAEQLYRTYIASFPNAEDRGEIEYYYAELMWERARNEKNPRMATELWEKAAVAFTDVVKSGKVDKNLMKEAAYASVLGWKNALAVDPRTELKEDDIDAKADAPIPEPKPIDGRQQKMLDAFDIYIKYIKDPKDDELVMMKFLKARIYWRHYHFDKSTPVFEDIVKSHPQHETAEWSVNIILDTYNRQKNYDKLLWWTDYLLDRPKFLEGKEELQQQLASHKVTSRRKDAEAKEKDGKHFDCGESYREIYNVNPNAKKVEEVLYNAGVCYEKANAVGLAIQMFGKLSERFPDHNLTQRALVKMGNLYGAVAYYDQAADKYESYATKYAGEKDASESYSRAVVYRKGLGQDDKAIKNIEGFVKLYKKKLKDDAADAFFGMAGIYEKRNEDDKVVKHLERYLREFGAAGGRDRVVVAHAKMGQILWDKACKGRAVDGSCIRVERERATRRRSGKRRRGSSLPTQCGEASNIKLTVVSRDGKLVNQARDHFRKALSEFEKLGGKGGDGDGAKALRMAQAVYWYAAARFYLVEADYEQYLALNFPTGLDFNPQNAGKAEKSVKRFKDWNAKKDQMAGNVAKKFRDVAEITGGGQAWRIAAAARTGQVFQNYAGQLYTAEIPSDVRSGPYAEDGVDAYCDALTTVAAPLEDKSIEAFGFCLEKSTELNWFNQWSKLCEKELGQIRPADYPTASEIHSQANNVAPVIDFQGAIINIK